MITLVSFYLIIFTIALVFVWVHKRLQHWANRKVRFRKSNFIFGESAKFVFGSKTMSQINRGIYTEHPDEKYIGYYGFATPKLLIRDPELIGHILTKEFSSFHDRQKSFDVGGRLIFSVALQTGERWHDIRTKIMPLFSQSKMKQMYGLIEKCAEILVDTQIRQAARSRNFVEIKDIMSKFALDVIGICTFGLEFNMLEKGNAKFMRIAKSVFSITPASIIRFFIQGVNPNWIVWFGMKHFPTETEEFFFNLLENAEKLRSNEMSRRNDFLQLMIDIRDEDRRKGERHETTSITLSFVLYELAINPHIQDKARQEIQNALEKYGGHIDYDNHKELNYLDMIISETLRKHSPVSSISRICNKSCPLPGTPLTIEPGENMIIPINGIHYDEKYYPDPEKFDPDRFTEENMAKRPPFTFLPFGDGPRICLGLRFAKVEMKCCLIALLSQFKFSVCEKTDIPIRISKKSIFYQMENAWLAVEQVDQQDNLTEQS